MIRIAAFAAGFAFVFAPVATASAELKEPTGFKIGSGMGSWYFTLRAEGRKAVLTGSGWVYKTREAAIAGAHAAAKHLCGDGASIRRDSPKIALKHKFSIRVKDIDKHHYVRVTGETYDSKGKAERGLAALRQSAGCKRR